MTAPAEMPRGTARRGWTAGGAAAGRTAQRAVSARVMDTAGEYVRQRFRAHVLDASYPCLGARSAVRTGAYRFGFYPELGSTAATERLAAGLSGFLAGRSEMRGRFQTFVATFAAPARMDEAAFEARLWTQLQRLHDLDAARSAWDPSVSADPEDPEFAFSFGGAAFFVVGLHPGSSRRARRFAWPTLVFNPHDQFRRLRREGGFARMQALIRQRDLELQGSLNPNLADHGTASDARQYSGRPVEPDWRCPFHARTS